MTNLERRAMARVPLTREEIEACYVPAHGIAIVPSREDVRRIRESHERLRMELEGATAMLAEWDRKAAHGCVDANCDPCKQGAKTCCDT